MKTCPFCGSRAALQVLERGVDIAPPCYFVRCSNSGCGVRTKAVGTMVWTPGKGYSDVPDAQEKAIAIWDTRA